MKYLFEVSWEVCNMVGGIHTVIRSKAAQTQKAFEDNYFLLGPLRDDNPEFEPSEDAVFSKITSVLKTRGIKCHTGHWAIDGSPRVILVDYAGREDTDKLLYQHWQQFGLDSMGSNWDYIEPMLFSTTCGEVIEAIHASVMRPDDSAVAQFHEWMSGAGLLHVKKTTPEIGTVFTTHATALGRAMANNGIDVLCDDVVINLERDAKKYGVGAKSSMEAVCAEEADVFTTVSGVTADEATKLLGKAPHYTAYNGLDFNAIGPIDAIREQAGSLRRSILHTAEKLLGYSLPSDTRLWATSGRYEFHNKGFDLFIETLATLNDRLKKQDAPPTIVAWFLVASANGGVKETVRTRLGRDTIDSEEDPILCTHIIDNEDHDAIINACQRLRLTNDPASPVKILFTPAYLKEDDGLFNSRYSTTISAFDLGVFPSNYEPWGYTAMETTAMGVPSITTDLSGFGSWILERTISHHRSITVIERKNKTFDEAADALLTYLMEHVHIDAKELSRCRSQARAIAETASWKHFFKFYQKTYDAANVIAEKRLNSLDTSGFSDELFISYKGTEGPGPHYRTLTVAPQLPESISKLGDLAYNMWWAWHPEAFELYRDLDEVLWETTNNNPVHFLEKVSPEQIQAKIDDPLYQKKYEKIMDDFESYLASPGREYPLGKDIGQENPIAYFSMEFCIHECLPIYSGGLGVLSGDHMKSASDLGLPLIGVGFFYKHGYFQQHVDINGMQVEHYPAVNPNRLPIEELKDADNNEIIVDVQLPGRLVRVKSWVVSVGRIRLYLLDTDLEENRPEDRQISSRLYGGGKTMRIEQEIILGMGGVKLIEDRLNLAPSVYHMNEGHCGFQLFERIERYMGDGLSFQEAREMVKASTVFTTHTPVPAGNETFNAELMTTYFADFAPRISISLDQLMEMGFSKPGVKNQEFSMTVLALKLSSRANGVSKLHGKVCQDMWKDVWKELDKDEVPITAITNGIHITSWIGNDMKRFLDQYLDIRWDENQDDPLTWMAIDQAPAEPLWYEHRAQKKRMIKKLKTKLYQDYTRRGESSAFINESINGLNSDALTIGFARRFATYKRATLLFHNREALVQLVNDPEHPVQLLFAGKAHPADVQGKDLIKRIIEESRTPEFVGKLFYVEDYNMKIGRLLTQGVDVWLNNPIRPHEASGTSGMKVVPNGGINCSILDGWWDEAYNEQVGYAINAGAIPIDRHHQDEMDNNALINILTSNIIPTYYERDQNEIPGGWVSMMKQAFKEMAPIFSTMRMVNEYHERMYIPTAIRSMALKTNEYAQIRSLTEWKRSIKARFSTAQVEHIKLKGLDGNMLPARTPFEIEMSILPGRMKPDELQVELVIGPENDDGVVATPETIPFEKVESVDPTVLAFHLKHKLESGGTFRYALRIVPQNPLLTCTQETGLVKWL